MGRVQRWMSVFALTGAAAGCTGTPEDTGGTLPPEDTGSLRDSTPDEFPIDTAPVGPLDESPRHRLTLRQWGQWRLLPEGGPYTRVEGELFVQEYVDDERPALVDTADTAAPEPEPLELDCDLGFALVGEPSEVTCAGCTLVFEVEHLRVLNSASNCHDPDLPFDTEIRRLAFAAPDAIRYDVGETGVWVPWYDAERDADVIDFAWEITVGFALDEEEE